jgi:hypothetical protein
MAELSPASKGIFSSLSSHLSKEGWKALEEPEKKNVMMSHSRHGRILALVLLITILFPKIGCLLFFSWALLFIWVAYTLREELLQNRYTMQLCKYSGVFTMQFCKHMRVYTLHLSKQMQVMAWQMRSQMGLLYNLTQPLILIYVYVHVLLLGVIKIPNWYLISMYSCLVCNWNFKDYFDQAWSQPGFNINYR